MYHYIIIISFLISVELIYGNHNLKFTASKNCTYKSKIVERLLVFFSSHSMGSAVFLFFFFGCVVFGFFKPDQS